MARNAIGAHIRFTDKYLESINSTPLTAFGYTYDYGHVVAVEGKQLWIKWESDQRITIVSDMKNVTTRRIGNYTIADRERKYVSQRNCI